MPELNEDSTKVAKDIVQKIKRFLYNCDLALVYANSEIQLRNAEIKLFEGDNRKKSRFRYFKAKQEKEQFEIFEDDINHIKDEITENLSIILDKYQPKYRQIFLLFFIESKSYQEIAEITHYSFEAVKVIIKRLKNDLITLYLP